MDVAKCLIFYYTKPRKKVYNFYLIYSVKQGKKERRKSYFIMIE